MKKFIIAAGIIVLLLIGGNIAYYRIGIYIDFHPDEPVTAFMTTDSDTIYMEQNGQIMPFEIRGVNMGVGIPGEWATDYAIDKETYLRWFAWIQEMGANTIRVYTILHDDFYNAFYEYNEGREEPLWLIHGVWVNDYVQNSHRDAYDNDFLQTLLDDCRTVVDIIHGQKTLSLGYGLGSGSYRKDISQWVIGYILGVEWEDVTVAYTDHKYPDRNSYSGTYLYTTEDATPFEAMLCQVGDKIIEYESNRYKQQRLIAFSNWPTTDPFDYPYEIASFFKKCAKVDVEHIRTTKQFISGYFASYHVYPYYPDYLNYYEDTTGFSYTEDGRKNTYLTYLKMLTEHHSIPVVISEYGVSTGRGMAQKDANTGRNQGNMSEQEQGQALIECYEDIMEAGCAGSCVFTWQDEWFKRTWNTMHAVDLDNTPYWSDYQTNEQYFGLLAFDPGEEKSISYVDGDLSEWEEEDLVLASGDMEISMKYDEKFLYFLIYKQDFDPEEDVLYIPIDITQKTGCLACYNAGQPELTFISFFSALIRAYLIVMPLSTPYSKLRVTSMLLEENTTVQSGAIFSVMPRADTTLSRLSPTFTPLKLMSSGQPALVISILLILLLPWSSVLIVIFPPTNIIFSSVPELTVPVAELLRADSMELAEELSSSMIF